MNTLNQDLVRVLLDERLTAARERQLAQQVRRDRREARRARRRARRAPVLAPAGPAPLTPLSALPVDELNTLLTRASARVTEQGTAAERRVLQAMSQVVRDISPGAADALVDWDGTEVARLRAFGIVHGLVLHALGPADRRWLLDELRGSGGRPSRHLVA